MTPPEPSVARTWQMLCPDGMPSLPAGAICGNAAGDSQITSTICTQTWHRIAVPLFGPPTLDEHRRPWTRVRYLYGYAASCVECARTWHHGLGWYTGDELRSILNGGAT